MSIKCLIIDDEPLAINVIKNFLVNFKNFELLGTCPDAVEGFNFLSKHEVDVIFLDINMPKISGLDFLKSLNKPPMIVITTAYREYAVESFELDVVDYLVKPFALQRFMKTVNRIESRLEEKNINRTEPTNSAETERPHVFFKVDKKMIKVYLDEILYIESLKDYIRIKTFDQSLINHNNLVSVAELLPADEFVRIHRSYIIAIKKVKVIDGNQVEVGDKLLPIGRNYQKDIKDLLLGT
ncbi:two component transcriptional regulator, LytTR family [Reichenbachiella agariperforans]|uniref:Two component transcriptional regulator, LytTR family n=1 Tax=Reichenbachiella agariperforans TaxID=156994 RepID=A0A1M6KMG7_REIAG|nr:LytTR family DNA-binding domain-containing protein [Reichenbachiella agariperforans]SHJ60044.1 two component transcriptional regulator, LytTR family [Reichenbachiella agariperforans]